VKLLMAHADALNFLAADHHPHRGLSRGDGALEGAPGLSLMAGKLAMIVTSDASAMAPDTQRGLVGLGVAGLAGELGPPSSGQRGVAVADRLEERGLAVDLDRHRRRRDRLAVAAGSQRGLVVGDGDQHDHRRGPAAGILPPSASLLLGPSAPLSGAARPHRRRRRRRSSGHVDASEPPIDSSFVRSVPMAVGPEADRLHPC
jgi:hypothetical protein